MDAIRTFTIFHGRVRTIHVHARFYKANLQYTICTPENEKLVILAAWICAFRGFMMGKHNQVKVLVSAIS